MVDRIRTGVMLLEDGTQMPDSVVVDTKQLAAGWSDIIGSTSGQLRKRIEDAGWTFFYMAGELHASGFGISDQSRTDHAVAHLIDLVKRQNCNCLEITRLWRRSFLGLPYTSVMAHARHIQKSRSFHDLSKMPARVPPAPPDWLYNKTPLLPIRSVAAVEIPKVV